MIRVFVYRFLLCVAFLLTMSAVALAQVIDPGTDPGGYLSQLLAFIVAKNWAFAIAVGLVGLVWVARKYALGWAVAKWPKLGGRLAGWLINFGLAVLAGVPAGLLAGKSFVEALITAITGAFTAAGVWEAVKDAQPKPAPMVETLK